MNKYVVLPLILCCASLLCWPNRFMPKGGEAAVAVVAALRSAAALPAAFIAAVVTATATAAASATVTATVMAMASAASASASVSTAATFTIPSGLGRDTAIIRQPLSSRDQPRLRACKQLPPRRRKAPRKTPRSRCCSPIPLPESGSTAARPLPPGRSGFITRRTWRRRDRDVPHSGRLDRQRQRGGGATSRARRRRARQHRRFHATVLRTAAAAAGQIADPVSMPAACGLALAGNRQSRRLPATLNRKRLFF